MAASMAAPNAMDYWQRGKSGSWGDDAAGFGKAGFNLVAGITNYLDSTSLMPLSQALGRNQLVTPYEIPDQQLGGAATLDAAMLLPIVVRAVTIPVRAYEVGTANRLLAKSVPYDGLDIHHVGQANPFERIIPNYDRATAPAIAIPRGQHVTIPTVRGPYLGTARDQLAKDIWDLRNYTDAPNSSLRELIDLNKQMYPEAFAK